MSADEIMESLDVTESELEVADELVQDHIEFFDNVQDVRTSRELPDGAFVHLHQLVVGPENKDYVVTEIGRETLVLVEVQPPVEHHGVAFLEQTVVSYGQLCMQYDQQTLPAEGDERDHERQPIFAY